MRFALLIAAGLGVLSSTAFAQRASPPPLPYQRALFHSDSIDITAVAASPDGKWLAFDGGVRGRSSIWVVAATGGDIHRLTDGAHDDLFPVWFPGGERIAFSTNRVRGIMAVGFDPARGTATGAPKRISVEPTVTFDISPDGKQVVYVLASGADGKARLRIAPSNGGSAKTIYEAAEQLVHPRFSTDGRTVYFTSWQRPVPGRVIKQVATTGGPATLVALPPAPALMAYPRLDRIVASRARGLLVGSMSGDSIALLPITRSPIYHGFSPDGEIFYQATGQVDAVIRLVSTAGGPTIDLTSPTASGYAYPYGWTTDNRLFYQTANDRTDTLFLGTVGSQRAQAYSLTPMNQLEGWRPTSRLGPSGDGRSVLMRVGHVGGSGLFLFDLESRKLTAVAKESLAGNVMTTDWAHSKEFHFFERTPTGIELKSVRAGEGPKVVAVLPKDAPIASVSLVGDRVLYRTQVGDSTVFFGIRGTMQEPKRFVSIPGSVATPVASPDGRWLVATAAVGASDGDQRVMFLPLGADGMPSGPPRFVSTDHMWDLAWTPDSRAVIGLEEEGMSPRTRIRRLPVDPKQAVTTIGPTNTTFWDAYLSPDGKYVAIPVERMRGSTLWAFDLKDASRGRRP